MSFSHVHTQNIEAGGASISGGGTYSGSSQVRVSETVVTGSTDFEIVVGLDVSAVKSIVIKSDKAVTLETNSGSAADDTIALKANVPYVWNTDSYDAFLLGTDVTSIFITNASGSTATITIDAIVDATP